MHGFVFVFSSWAQLFFEAWKILFKGTTVKKKKTFQSIIKLEAKKKSGQNLIKPSEKKNANKKKGQQKKVFSQKKKQREPFILTFSNRI